MSRTSGVLGVTNPLVVGDLTLGFTFIEETVTPVNGTSFGVSSAELLIQAQDAGGTVVSQVDLFASVDGNLGTQTARLSVHTFAGDALNFQSSAGQNVASIVTGGTQGAVPTLSVSDNRALGNHVLEVWGDALVGGGNRVRIGAASGLQAYNPLEVFQDVTFLSPLFRITPLGNVDCASTGGALIVPRLTTAQKNALAAVDGMIVYDTTLVAFQKRVGGAWVAF